MVRWLRESNFSAIILALFRLYIGYTFFTHGLQKVMGGFDACWFPTRLSRI